MHQATDKAAAHMSLHLNQQCQRTDENTGAATFTLFIGLVSAPGSWWPQQRFVERHRLGEAAFMEATPTRQHLISLF
jgi:hypothetical protein